MIVVGTVLKYVCLVTSIVYTFSNIVKAFRRHAISAANLWIMAVSIAAFCLLTIELGY